MNENNSIPIVSIVVCTYNRKKLLSRCLNYILNQKINFKIEILVGDDCSSDGTIDLLETFKKKYDFFNYNSHSKNVGIGINWALTVKQAKGKYIAFCDDDDYWHDPHKLQIQVDFLELNKNIGLIHTGYIELNNNKFKIKLLDNIENESENVMDQLLSGRYQILYSTVMVRSKEFFSQVQLNDYITFKFPIQDWNTWVLMSRLSIFKYLPITTTTYNLTENSLSRIDDIIRLENKLELERKMYIYLYKVLNKYNDFVMKDYDKYRFTVLFRKSIKLNNYAYVKKYENLLNNLNIKNREVLNFTYLIKLSFVKIFFFKVLKK